MKTTQHWKMSTQQQKLRALKINRFRQRFLSLLKHPFFWVLTLVGNSIIFIGSLMLYFFEGPLPGGPTEYIDCLLWSTETVTTVGFGYYTPQTMIGKLTIFLLMLTGPLFMWSYMAFMMTGLIAPELSALEKDVHEVEKEIRDLHSNNPANR